VRRLNDRGAPAEGNTRYGSFTRAGCLCVFQFVGGDVRSHFNERDKVTNECAHNRCLDTGLHSMLLLIDKIPLRQHQKRAN